MRNKNFADVLKQIKHLLEMGYQLRFAGGTNDSKNCDEDANTISGGNKNTTVVPIMIDSHKNLWAAVVPYELNANIKKNDDEKNHEWTDEDFKDLTVRKLEEEIGYSAQKSDLVFIYQCKVRDNRYKDRYVPHTKRLYLVEKFDGQLLLRNNGSLLKCETHDPLWVPARILPDFLFEGHLIFFEKLVDFLYKEHQLIAKDYYAMKENIMIRKTFGLTKNKTKKLFTAGTH